MINELMQNKLLVIGVSLFVGLILYFLIFRKNKDLVDLENEYEEILTSNKHKVKGQHD